MNEKLCTNDWFHHVHIVTSINIDNSYAFRLS